MKTHYIIASSVVLSAMFLTGCSLFPSDNSRPIMPYPTQPTPAYPAPPVPGNPGPDTSVTSSPVGDGGTDIINQIALDEASCKAAHGHWNACASPCRNQPDAQACIEMCMMVCECGGIAGFGCPAGYACGDYVPPNAMDAMGICKPIAVKPTTTSKEFNNPKTFTSIVVIGSMADGRVTVGNPFTFYGTTTVFENQFSWRVKDDAGKILASGQAMTNSPDMGQLGAYKITAILDSMPTGKNGTVEVFDNSPKDGAEQIMITVPLTFVGLKTADVSIYFVNQKLAKDPNDCSEVQPVKRTVVVSPRIEEAAMHALLGGPTAKELAAGYTTALPKGVHQPTMEWGRYTNVINFDDTLTQGMAGSCRVLAAQAQLEKTMGTACVKTHCLFSVNGGAEQALQP